MTIDQADRHSARQLILQALAHGAVFFLLVCGLLLLDAWETQSAAGGRRYLAATGAFISGMGLSHIIHEWGHFLGAVLSKSRLTIKSKIFPLFFDFDYNANTPRQFLSMSWGGLLGNILLLVMLLLVAAPQTLVLASLTAAVLGQFIYVIILELPVSLRVLAGEEPLEALTAHFGRGGPLFLRATLGGLGTAALVFIAYSQSF